MNSTTAEVIIAQIAEWEATGINPEQISAWVSEILADLFED